MDFYGLQGYDMLWWAMNYCAKVVRSTPSVSQKVSSKAESSSDSAALRLSVVASCGICNSSAWKYQCYQHSMLLRMLKLRVISQKDWSRRANASVHKLQIHWIEGGHHEVGHHHWQAINCWLRILLKTSEIQIYVWTSNSLTICQAFVESISSSVEKSYRAMTAASVASSPSPWTRNVMLGYAWFERFEVWDDVGIYWQKYHAA